MNELKKRLAKVNLEIAEAKASKEKQKRRIKIKRSYKGDTTNNVVALKATEVGLDALEAERKSLTAQLGNQQADKEYKE